MKNILLTIDNGVNKVLLVFMLLISGLQLAYADFYAVAHRNTDTSASGHLFIFGDAGVTGSISSVDGGMNQSFTIPASGVLEVSVAQARFFQTAEVDTTLNRALLVSSSDPISGYMLNRRQYTTDMSFLHDVDMLGHTFHLVSYTPLSSFSTQFSFTAVEDGTTVSVTPTVALTSGQAAGTTFTKVLNAGESLYYESTQDLTGSLLSSDKPIAVFSGNACANVPTGNGYCDHLFTQLPAVANYAQTFIVPETGLTGSAGDAIRVVAHSDNTAVSVNGSVVATLNAGEFYEISTAVDTLVETTEPALVVQYLKGGSATGNNGDPSLSFIPGTNQVLSSYSFSTPTGTAAFSQNYLNVAVPDSALASLTLNGTVVNTSGFVAIGSTGYSSGNISIPVGTGAITANEGFVVSISGYSPDDSYLTILGTTFAQGANPTYTIGGTVSGLNGTIVLQNNGGDDLTINIDGPFTFPTAVSDGAAYNATILTPPAGQTCTVSNGNGTVNGSNISNIQIACRATVIAPVPATNAYGILLMLLAMLGVAWFGVRRS